MSRFSDTKDETGRGIVQLRNINRKFYNSLETKVSGMNFQLRTLQMKVHSPIGHRSAETVLE